MTKIAKIILSVSIAALVVATSVTIVIVSTNKKHEQDSDSSHVHAFTDQKAEEQYLASPATCTERAKYYYSCACGEKGSNTFANGDALGHSFTNYTSDNNATCTQDGTKTAKCDRCGEVNTVADEGSKLEHNFDKQVAADEYLATPATCTEKAKYYYSCACGEKGSNTFANGDALGHNFGEWETVSEPTETKKGLKKRVCERENCGYSESKEIPELSHEHSYTEKEVGERYLASAATCTKSATYYYSCACGEKGAETFEYGYPTGHSYTEQKIDDKYLVSAATCTESAVYYYSCRCGEKTDSPWQTFEYGNPKGHTEVIDEAVAATRTENGLTEGKHCSVCNEIIVIQEEIPATGSKGLLFTVNSDGQTCTVSMGTCTDEDVIIPEYSPKKHMVTVIGENAFSNSAAKSINISKNVTSIGNRAFYGCDSMQTIVIPGNVKTIGGGAFYNCTNLLSVKISCGVEKIGPEILAGCSNLESLSVPFIGAEVNADKNSSEIFPFGYFFGRNYFPDTYCAKQRNVVDRRSVDYYIPYSLKTVEVYESEIFNYAFEKCIYIENIIVNPLLNEIGEYAFSGCVYLKNFTIPSSVTEIKEGTFQSCASLDSIVLPEGVTKVGISAFDGCERLSDITLPNGLQTIDICAFARCKSLKSIVIPDTVTDILSGAFEDCECIESITVPYVGFTWGDDLYSSSFWFKYIDVYDKYDETKYCRVPRRYYDPIYGQSLYEYSLIPISLRKIEITQGENIWGFEGWSCLKSVKLPNTAKKIDDRCFLDCSELAEVDLCEGVESIGSAAFSGCINLNKIVIPDSVTSIGDGAFLDCKQLQTVKIGRGIKTISDAVFGGCGFSTVSIPDNITILKNGAFAGCELLKNISFGNGLKKIESNAFKFCSKLKETDIPDTVCEIGEGAFSYCNSLETVRFGKGLEKVSSDAFYKCDSLKSVFIKDLAKWCVVRLENDCSNPVYYARSILIDEKKLVNCVIPSGVDVIGDFTFVNCDSIISISVPDSVTKIGSCAFSQCDNLTDVSISSGVKEICDGAFGGCISLSRIYIPDTVKKMGGVFSGCMQLSEVRLPTSITEIDYNMFRNCFALVSLVIPESVSYINDGAFYGCSEIKNIYCFGNCPDYNPSYNECLSDVTFYYYSETMPTESEKYWHYDGDGITPTIWKFDI